MESDGLANNTINSIQQDSNGNIWVSTNKACRKLKTKQAAFKL